MGKTESTPPRYDPETCISVRALRDLGFTVDEHLPDTAFVKRRELRFAPHHSDGYCSATVKHHDTGDWLEICVKVETEDFHCTLQYPPPLGATSTGPFR